MRQNEDLERRIRERTDEVVRQKNDLARANDELNRLVRQVEDKSRELEEARIRAEQASRAKGEFLAHMSHEIRTPMGAILGMTELAIETDMTPEQQRYLRGVKQAAESLLTVINDVLDFAKIEAGKLDLNHVAFRLRDTLASALDTVALRGHDKGLELVLDVTGQVPDFLIGDPVRLRQIVLNLVGNAIKFTERGEIVISVATEWKTADEVSLRLAVSDTGIGIPVEVQRRIFEAFSQAEAPADTRSRGTGLGLAISSQLAELMGGRVWVESEPGRGSTFTFTARFGRQARPSERPGLTPPTELKDLGALVVDDNGTVRRVVSDMLRAWHLQPLEAADMSSAVETVSAARDTDRPIALVLVDAELPGDAFEAAAGLRTANPDLAIAMMLPPGGELRHAPRCRELGLDAYVIKPVDHAHLLETVNVALGLANPSPERRATAGVSPPVRLGRPLRILAADDNAVNQELVRHLLTRRGHAVQMVGDGRQALEALARDRYDVLLLDVQMPEVDGIQVAQAVRERERTTGDHIPIVAMTAAAMKGDRERCLEAGMDRYVTKPIHAPHLFEAVEGFAVLGGDTDIPGRESVGQEDLILDRAALLARIDGDRALLRRMVEPFIAECPGTLGAIEVGLNRQDCDAVARAAHFLKGAVANFCSKPVYEIALGLERMARSGDLSGGREHCDALERGLDRLKATLSALVAERPEPACSGAGAAGTSGSQATTPPRGSHS